MHRHFFASYPCLLMYECGYTSTAFLKRNLSKVNIYARCVLCSQHLFHFETNSFECAHSNANICCVKKQNRKKGTRSNGLVHLSPRSLVRVAASLRSAR